MGFPSSSKGGPAIGTAGGDVVNPDEAAPFAELDADEKASLKKWLDDKKEALQCLRDTPEAHFVAKFRGSSWTASKRGVGSDVAVGEATDDDAGTWAARVIGNKMASFSLNKCGEELAGALADF